MYEGLPPVSRFQTEADPAGPHRRPSPTKDYLLEVTRACSGQRGFSAIETAIIFIAFVTLAAVFGFAVMSTGVLTSEASKESVLHGLEATSGTLFQSGAIIGAASSSLTAVDTIKFQIINATRGTDGVIISPDQTGLSYIDEHQVVRLASNQWTATWLTGFGSLINPGERVEIEVDLTGLNPRLGSSKEFFIELTTGPSVTLRLRRVTPATLLAFFDIP